jgi:hypothetical protein
VALSKLFVSSFVAEKTSSWRTSMSSEHLNDAAAVRTTFATWWHSLIVRSKTVQVGNVQKDASGFIRFSTAKAVKAERHANRAVVCFTAGRLGTAM